jgi:bacterioferritin
VPSWRGRALIESGISGGDMKGDVKTIEYLNRVLKNELAAINQYFLHARMFKNWGYAKLDAQECKESVDEMKHADRLIERILFLEGLPNLQDIGRLRIGENAHEILRADLATEREAMPVLREAVAHCESRADYVTRELFEDILTGEEEHLDWLERQLGLIEQIGLANYLQSQV